MDKKLLTQVEKEDLINLQSLRKNAADFDFQLKIQQQNVKIHEYKKKIAELQLENAILTIRLEYGLGIDDVVNENGQILRKKN